jgi:hypothetical protein
MMTTRFNPQEPKYHFSIKNKKGDVFMFTSKTFFNGLRNITRFLSVAVFLSLTVFSSIPVFAAAPAGGGMAFFTSAIDTLKTLVIALGAGLAVWGVINLLEGYGNDNPGAKSQGIKQLMSGGGVILIGLTVIPLLSNLFG